MINMKTPDSILTFTIALSLLGAISSSSQNPKAPESFPASQENIAKLQDEAEQLQERTRQEAGIAQEQAQAARHHVEQARKQLVQAAPVAGRPIYADRLQNIIRRAPGGSAKALVIRSADGD